MQYHLDGFRPGDPHLHPAAEGIEAQGERVDVLIVGTGPAGLTLAAQLSAFPGISTRIVERRAGPLEKGQADGISCRSMEMFAAFGFADAVMAQGYWVNETTFWKPDPASPASIARSGRIQDVEDGLSEMPHMILNQARVHDFYLDIMARSPHRLAPVYNRQLVDLTVGSDAETHPVAVRLERLDAGHEGEIEEVRARYVVGCDGARSAVRRAIGRELVGDSANQAWGVMDVLAVTDFPDIRCKTLIQSAEEGNIIIIPREGGYLVRLYIELDRLKAGERVASRNITVDQLIGAAQRIFRPYSLDVQDVVWWSVYEIGQRLTERFDDVPHEDPGRLPRVFIAGDACHTHSPKAGQGMNVSMGDSFNLGWKLASVLNGLCAPALLHSYSAERQAVARDLIEFDREWSRIISAPPTADPQSGAPQFQRYFIEHGRYTAGMSVRYAPSAITGTDEFQHLATGFDIGSRFHSAPVVRLADAKPLELGHVIKADGRWRLFAFAPEAQDVLEPGGAIQRLCDLLDDPLHGPVRAYTPPHTDPDSLFDLRLVMQHREPEYHPVMLPGLLAPRKGRFGLIDYEKVFFADRRPGRDIFALRGIDRAQGCLVVVRPDQHVAHVLRLDDAERLSQFLAGIFLKQPRP